MGRTSGSQAEAVPEGLQRDSGHELQVGSHGAGCLRGRGPPQVGVHGKRRSQAQAAPDVADAGRGAAPEASGGALPVHELRQCRRVSPARQAPEKPGRIGIDPAGGGQNGERDVLGTEGRGVVEQRVEALGTGDERPSLGQHLRAHGDRGGLQHLGHGPLRPCAERQQRQQKQEQPPRVRDGKLHRAKYTPRGGGYHASATNRASHGSASLSILARTRRPGDDPAGPGPSGTPRTAHGR